MAEADWSRAGLVRACYQVLLGRPPETPEALAGHVERNVSPEQLIETFAFSIEARERRRQETAMARLVAATAVAPWAPGALRVLLFGAYGNGNLGDAIQAEAVASLLRASTARPLDIRACSWIDFEPYPFPADQVAPFDTIAFADALAGFDLLLIGGGGLFGASHFPLSAPDWVAHLRASGLPYGLVGIGATAGLPGEDIRGAAWRSLLPGAAFVSGRDRDSLAAMPGGHWLVDPVLLAGLRDGGGAPARPGGRPLFIVKRAAHDNETAFLAWLAAAPREADIVAIEPRLEAVLQPLLPSVQYTQSMAELQARCAAASVVVSMRYHGCIAALLAGVPCLGIGTQKNRDLFEALGAPDRFITDHAALPALLAAPPPALDPGCFAPLRQASDAALRALAGILDALPLRHVR